MMTRRKSPAAATPRRVAHHVGADLVVAVEASEHAVLRTREEQQLCDAAWSLIRVVRQLHIWRDTDVGRNRSCTCLICQKARVLHDALRAAGIKELVVPHAALAPVEDEVQEQVELHQSVLAQLRKKEGVEESDE